MHRASVNDSHVAIITTPVSCSWDCNRQILIQQLVSQNELKKWFTIRSANPAAAHVLSDDDFECKEY